MWSLWMVWPEISLMSLLPLHRHGERTVDHEVRAGDAAGHRAGEEDHAVGHFLCRAEAAGQVDLERRGKQVGHVLLDVLPDAAVEVGVARRDAVDADALGDELPAQTLGIVDQSRLDRSI